MFNFLYIFIRETIYDWLPVCFSIHQTPSDFKGSALKRENLPLEEHTLVLEKIPGYKEEREAINIVDS